MNTKGVKSAFLKKQLTMKAQNCEDFQTKMMNEVNNRKSQLFEQVMNRESVGRESINKDATEKLR